MTPGALDSPIWHSLTGRLAPFAEMAGPGPLAGRLQPDVGPFAAVSDVHDPASWSCLAELVGPGGLAVVMVVEGAAGAGSGPWPPKGWDLAFDIPGLQMAGEGMEVAAPGADPDLVDLGPADAVEMAELVERTRPGPFGPRTVELGGYLGVRRQGSLVAMAGHRLRPPGSTEISAVCTDPSVRGQGLGGRLVRAVAGGIVARGEVPVLHVAATNAGAIRLYQALGMRRVRRVRFAGLRAQ